MSAACHNFVIGADIHIVFVQVGNYKGAFERFETGGEETYGNQRRSVEAVADLVNETTRVTVVCARTSPYDTLLPNGVRAIGMNEHESKGQAQLLSLVKSLDPTHLIVRGPRTELFQWGLAQGIEVLPIFADSFNLSSFTLRSLRQRFRTRKLVRLLNNPKVRTVSNHNINASRSLCTLGVQPRKVVPYDYSRGYSPDEYQPKVGPSSPDAFRMVYVGAITEPKGVFDILDAIPIMESMGLRPTLSVIGKHDGILDDRIKTLGIEHAVTLMGRLPNAQVREEMRSHDAVIVPSQHRYPEGLPHTIFEALATRTPLIASDHPMFTPVLKDERHCVMFPAGNAKALAQAAHRLVTTPGLYEQISGSTQEVWDRLCMPLDWHEVIELWLEHTPSAQARLDACSIAQMDASASTKAG
ncbi:MAG: glycosyltransferase family 4 protein [Phycisphaerales bacterium]